MRKFMKQLKNERGLTLVELLAVVVILGIVGTIGFVSIGNVIENSKEDAAISNAMQAISAAKLAEASVNEFPAAGFSTSPDSNVDGQKELDTMGDLTDPWTKAAKPDYVITVTKKDDGYYVHATGAGGCNIGTATTPVSETDLLTKDRSDICTTD